VTSVTTTEQKPFSITESWESGAIKDTEVVRCVAPGYFCGR